MWFENRKNTCKTLLFVLYYISTFDRGVAQLVARVVWDHEVAGSIPVTSTIFRPFFKKIQENLKTVKEIEKCYFLRNLENSIIFLHSKKFSKIPIFCSEKCSAILKIFKKLFRKFPQDKIRWYLNTFSVVKEKLKGELLLWILYLIKQMNILKMFSVKFQKNCL